MTSKDDVSVPCATEKDGLDQHSLNALEIGERRLRCKVGVSEILEPASLNKLNGGRPNLVRTTQFTPLSWIPKSLYNQFKRMANIYFLFIAVLVCLSEWLPEDAQFSPKDWRSKLGPFILVLFWTACKDLYEDIRRAKDDKRENYQVVKRWNVNNSIFEQIRWIDVLVGDLLYITCDGAFPGDLLLLKSAENETAFISTVMLDGETNLKDKNMPQVLSDLAEAASKQKAWEDKSGEVTLFILKLLEGTEVKMGPPSPALSDVRGIVSIHDQPATFPISEANFLPRGCILRNTPYCLGLVLYAGGDTKTRLNATDAVLKFSNMQKALNACIKLLLLAIFAIDVYATIMSQVVGNSEFSWPLMFFRFCIAYYHAVPMSLYVVYEMLKLVLGYQIGTDTQMVADDEPALARTADLMEEMGQVDFIFSDKTGTLTANEMVFAYCHINGKDLGDFRKTEDESNKTEESEETEKRCSWKYTEKNGVENAKAAMKKDDAHAEAVKWYFTCLATCHEVVAENKSVDERPSVRSSFSSLFSSTREKRKSVDKMQASMPGYTGMSPDEVALVRAARDVGVVFAARNRVGGVNELEIQIAKEVVKYEVLVLIQFTSDRKRMSVIVRGPGGSWCITKGADSTIEPRLQSEIPSAASRDILKYSKAGLRTLIVASRKLDDEFLSRWLADYQEARGILDNTKEEKIADVVAQLETDMHFVGLTSVEDRLQDGVPEAIATLKEAGSRVWVLTGDKTETAVNIAYSCALFEPMTQLAYCTGASDVESARAFFQKAINDLDGATDAGVVIDGGTLLFALSDEQCRKDIFDLGMASQACICTRLSPMQKLQLVQLVREADRNRITLAIGDGANDVPMILGGHVGIGIRGKEGCAAVQVCDVAISRFRFLVPLLLCHGCRSYRRVAAFLCYFLYKNVCLLMADLVWMHWDKFRGNIAFSEYLSIGFNAFFTSVHVLIILGFDRDVPDVVACHHPEIYKVGPRRELFNIRVFSKWMAYAVLHGGAAWLIPFGLIGTDTYATEKFWTCSTSAFTAVVFVTLLRLVIVCENPLDLKVTWLPTLAALLMYVIYLIGLGYTPIGWNLQPNMKFVPGNLVTRGDVFGTIILTVVLALLIDLVERIVQTYLFPSKLRKLQNALAKRSTVIASSGSIVSVLS